MRLSEDGLTILLVVACGLLAAIALVPRWLERPAPLRVEVPDVQVSIEGSVARPGVYRLAWGARVADLVSAAGGMLPGAAHELVALAEPLTDGDVVQVPAAVDPEGERRVRLNSASVDELVRLPGVGPELARRIVAARPFASVDELVRVRGIGARTLAALRSRVRL